MAVDGIDVYFMPCLHINYDEEESWHCMIWGDLGCGQTLKTEITQGLHGLHGEPFNIEGMVEMIYSNIEIYSAQGDVIPVVYSESLPENDEKALAEFRLGAVRDYKSDEYRETTVCAELIENLYEAVQTGTIEEQVQRESVEAKELSITEKIDYIKKEETGKYFCGHFWQCVCRDIIADREADRNGSAVGDKYIFEILEIEPTCDAKKINDAYTDVMKKYQKKYRPEEYLEKWKEIHDAYIMALGQAREEWLRDECVEMALYGCNFKCTL